MADTTVTAQTVIDNSLTRLKDPKKTQWSDAYLLTRLKKAHAYVQRLLMLNNSELAITSGAITMTATQEFTLSGNLDNFWKMIPNGVFFAGETPMTQITVEDAKREGTTTTDDAPTCFYLTATALGVVNIPTATSIAAYPTLTCRYFAMETALTLASTMPYKNILNEPMSAFMDHLAIIKTTAPAEEYTAIYNTLEESTFAIIRQRAGL